MAEKIYYFLNGLVLAILIAVNVRSHGQYVAVMAIYAFLWTIVELVYGMICDVIEIKKEREHRGRKR